MAAITFRLNAPGHFFDVHGQRDGFVLLAVFLATWIFIRTSARINRSGKVSWWPGSVKTSGGLHLHHLVWGIVMLMVCGFLEFALDPQGFGRLALAGFFGAGVGLTLDEFALWIYLQDVYWAQEGRDSFDAVVVAVVFAALILVGVAPFDTREGGTTIAALALVLVLEVGLGIVAIDKGKLLTGLIGIFIPLVALVGALRLAKPDSRWARRRYPAGGDRARRSAARGAELSARWQRISNLIAGAPSEPDPIASPGSASVPVSVSVSASASAPGSGVGGSGGDSARGA